MFISIEQFKSTFKSALVNRQSLRLRLKRTDWHGIPLPTGKKGTLVITNEMMIQLPKMSIHELSIIMRNRASDLKVDIEIINDPIAHNIVIKWNKRR